MGLDLGQRRDHSAIAVVERSEALPPWQGLAPRELRLRLVERVPLGTPYPAVVERVKAIATSARVKGDLRLAVDATGVGAPVVDLLRTARLGFEVTAVTMTGGERATNAGSRWNVPKRDLMAGVQVLLERGELRIARGMRDTPALIRELMDVRASTRSAEGGGEHDDLVVAVALACWRAKWTRNQVGQNGWY
ncbi:MAG TPA: hypothetical protein VEF06_04025 [Bryobacteraceae bacterium]|nr:hypothetical protein [Bryobacteraceae bacterium]